MTRRRTTVPLAETVTTDPIAYSYTTAAAAVGTSESTIKRAVAAGDLPVVAGTINGKSIARPVILAEDLRAWLRTVQPQAS